MIQLTVKSGEQGQRLDKYLSRYLKEAPKSFLYKMMRKKNITLNSKKADGSEKLREGDEIRLYLADDTVKKFMGSGITHADCPLDILYEDSHIIFINKPAGMLSQKAKKDDTSLVEYLTGYLLSSGQMTQNDLLTFHPAVCNRLDRNTSGIVGAGKTIMGLQMLSAMFKERSLHKYYLALAAGEIKRPAYLKGYLWKNNRTNKVTVLKEMRQGAVPIETKYTPLSISEDKSCTLLKIQLLTGRSHQIRSHLASIGHPVIGDGKYGNDRQNQYFRKKYGVQYQLLHAWELELPVMEGEWSDLSSLQITAEPPEIFRKVIKGEKLDEEKI